MKQSLKLLYLNRVFAFISANILGLFLPIFLYQNFNNNINLLVLFYLISYIFTLICLPLVAKLMNKINFKNSIILGAFCFSIYLISLNYIDTNIYYILITLFAIVLFRILYWVPYLTDVAKLTNIKKRGQEIALIMIITTILSVVLPYFSAILVNYFSFKANIYVAVIMSIIAIIPLFAIKKIDEEYSYTYFQTFKELFSKKNRKMLIANFGIGAETMISIIIWPIFIFQILNGKYLQIGLVSSFAVLITVLLEFIVGKLTDKKPKHKILKFGTLLYSIGWIFKIFVTTLSQIFIINIYHSLSYIIKQIPYESIVLENNSKKGRLIDEYTLLRELALNFGRISMLLLIWIIFQYFDINISFVLAAFAGLLVTLL